mmetsp:Transcript_11124/g.19085  ORF Transcript_11124/g.19085 Transcript_11124/m.19085 type:complete len:221 (+) Transcript_11124:96-758(+)
MSSSSAGLSHTLPPEETEPLEIRSPFRDLQRLAAKRRTRKRRCGDGPLEEEVELELESPQPSDNLPKRLRAAISFGALTSRSPSRSVNGSAAGSPKNPKRLRSDPEEENGTALRIEDVRHIGGLQDLLGASIEAHMEMPGDARWSIGSTASCKNLEKPTAAEQDQEGRLGFGADEAWFCGEDEDSECELPSAEASPAASRAPSPDSSSCMQTGDKAAEAP